MRLMKNIRKPAKWSDEALAGVMARVAADEKARAHEARVRLVNDPVERARVLAQIKINGFGLDENQQLILPADLMRGY